MAFLIGMDEAGLGPNLGPFVVATTVWEVPGEPDAFDFWSTFDAILTRTPRKKDPRLHIADSKEVFQPHKGLDALERGVWAALQLCGVQADSWSSLRQALACTGPRPEPCTGTQTGKPKPKARVRKSLFEEADPLTTGGARWKVTDEVAAVLPWYAGDSCSLPGVPVNESIVATWRQACEQCGVRLVAIRADVVEPARFNQLVRDCDNKARATSRIALQLLQGVWHPGEPALIVADKHGGRNRYEELLDETFGCEVTRVVEGSERSVYRVGEGEIRFQPRAESHGPVALASMTAKYLRELAMHRFNQFWRSHIPDLKPTQGYPGDAQRFWDQIAEEIIRQQIPEDVLWRSR